MRNIVVILAGGTGSRLNADIPKQFLKVAGKPVISYCLERFLRHARIDAAVVGVAGEWRRHVEEVVEKLCSPKPVYYAPAGSVRQETIYRALQVAAAHFDGEDIVIFHDAARPNASARLIDACLDACVEYDGAMPVLPVKDTVYQSEDGTVISSLLPRETLYAGQAPEAFRLGKYLEACESLPYEALLKIHGSSEAAYRHGLKIRLVPGEESNFKITVPEDLERFKLLVRP